MMLLKPIVMIVLSTLESRYAQGTVTLMFRHTCIKNNAKLFSVEKESTDGCIRSTTHQLHQGRLIIWSWRLHIIGSFCRPWPSLTKPDSDISSIVQTSQLVVYLSINQGTLHFQMYLFVSTGFKINVNN